MWLFALFVAVPIIEIALFIQVGGLIGLWPTLLIVVVTAILGTALVRQQGALAMSQLRQSFAELNDPAEPLAHGAMILLSGALLLTPGFFTDTVGFLLLIPAFRTFVLKELRKRVKVQSFVMGQQAGFTQTRPPYRQNPQDPGVIDGEWEELDADKPKNQGPSGWTRH
ncbi:exlusion protein FxsA [Celeribacter ethanolicus]|uniref:Exlusion protein FxsA n=1 Tax=Celeribacter ethanolicus TaxID=1758178 RepID=A0A291GDC9_9RHOB|nr:FxsA family protein [Celeribacter ethanolicus]ATG48389.1 exlusion protein FxsA [Celeribacter ethanolicus]